ncbi:uncharacterized protein PHALS_11987 [Plasmopara halstedii]|uniref:Uncharacterized protein n=1 Tax=Plasmopara halstedii TaxID=4781 RepID=A0A0P1AKL6_PLAHL|nr:uncharacterized protein PHALS_11987 [Plasmopara halstedii]CEG41655.1 hypothetical protein PHALS_11987 [Plasmopara halstedii]|eukprot:XP_024578024.1 hypothetical protein PHALS_11987 [Plasmopara halstedii]
MPLSRVFISVLVRFQKQNVVQHVYRQGMNTLLLKNTFFGDDCDHNNGTNVNFKVGILQNGITL